jgi:hypothetical protein
VLLVLPSLAVALFPPDQVFHDGFEIPCPVYYPDTDEDGFGDPENPLETCDGQPPGTVLNAGDCDDNSEAINPDAEEFTPDNLYVDENCDGIDGNVAMAVFVSSLNGSDTQSCGDINEPCQSIAKGLQRAQEQELGQLYLQEGNWLETNVLAQDVAIYGGYGGGDWVRADRTAKPSVVTGAFNDVRNVTFEVSGTAVEFHNMVLNGPGAPPAASDLNSYVIFGNSGSTIVVMDSLLVQGTGGDGGDGEHGTLPGQPAAQPGDPGSPGAQFTSSCNLVRADGGGKGVNPSAVQADGGAGGKGGSMDTSCITFLGQPICDNCTARSGLTGDVATRTSPLFGLGGAGGPGADTCGPGQPGRAGVAATDGAGGNGGTGGSIIGGLWVSSNGANGKLGTDGGGGGGGGGAGGCDIGLDTRGSGGGGGGAGGARAADAGTAGIGGGGSFGIHVNSSALLVQDSVIQRGTGGKGGDGGDRGHGQTGGGGGNGGPAVGGSSNAGRGGDGADGGDSGAGGGGAGGPSCAIVSVSSTPVLNGNSYMGGTGGSGGAGGAGNSTTKGQSGSPGQVCVVLD